MQFKSVSVRQCFGECQAWNTAYMDVQMVCALSVRADLQATHNMRSLTHVMCICVRARVCVCLCVTGVQCKCNYASFSVVSVVSLL